MGRRALRKVSPELDLQDFLYELENLPRPFDAEELFGRAAPLEIEVGSGKGLFLQTACAGDPATNFFGIELARKYARYCAARLAVNDLTNGKVLSGDALRFFHEWLPDRCAEAVHVYFPDPWWKKRHHKRRVMNEAFAQQIQRVLKVGGRLHFWTDVEEYYAATLELLSSVTQLAGPTVEEAKPAEHTLDYRTHFERRTRLNEQPVYRARFVRP